MITVVLDVWLEPSAFEAGIRLMRKMCLDMRGFDGYKSHRLLLDQDSCGHMIALVSWRQREDADRMRINYSESETFRQLTPLLTRARERWVMEEDFAAGSAAISALSS